jgi:Na+/proline symporter
VLALVVAALAMLVATIWMIFVSDPSLQSVTGMDGVWVMVGASAVPVGLWLYARWLKIAQVLG